ncbi:EAL and HDOD domain-containing protein [Chryseomicrobium palamuruense]|uniref:EAL and HDOD domain-containing protein n=1 Tax=Chryseomicrobium palamuruense TaxID=682973 RepID=A0ABV8UTZ9_9BACL
MDHYLARQPIVDTDRNVIAYELLSRNSEENVYSDQDPHEATRRVLETAFHVMGLDYVSHGLPVFVNFTRDLIVNYRQLTIPPGSLTIEVLESIEFDEELLKALQHLKKAGYQLALDDFNCNSSVHGIPDILRTTDFIKIDFRAPFNQQQCTENLAKRSGKKLIAEKVETFEDYQRALDSGYTYFQGYFFGKPEVLYKKSTSLMIDDQIAVHLPHL